MPSNMSAWPTVYSTAEKGDNNCKKYNCPWGDCNTNDDKNAAGEKCPWVACNKVNCKVPWHKPCEGFTDPSLLGRLSPMVFCVGLVDATFGVVLLAAVALYAGEFYHLYGSERAIVITFMSSTGLAVMVIGGLILMVGLLCNKRQIMWLFILSSSFLCVYIFTLGVMMISFAMNNPGNFVTIENNIVKRDMKKFLTGKPFVIGVLTLLGSVIHFVGSIAVFTYYNLKYIYPVMFTRTVEI